MSRSLIAALLAVPLVLAGCVAPGSELDTASVADLLPIDTPLWDDKQNAPHPAFGWPTLTNLPTGENVPEWWTAIPAAELPDPIRGLEHVAKSPDDVVRGGGIALFGRIAVVPGYGAPTSVMDISDPAAPVVLAQIENKEGQPHRGAAFIAYPNGTLVFVVSTPKVIEVYDVTDPSAPVELPSLPTERSHKVGVVPGTPIVYNANSRGGATDVPSSNTGKGAGVTEIFDLTNPWAPVLVQEFQNGYGCHHIFFWNSAEKQRAICAGLQYTQIWDVADPRNPGVIVNVPVHHGNPALPSTSLMTQALAFSHFSILNDDGTVLIVGDETFGGGRAACDGPGPMGNLWFYDVKDEKNPKLLGWFDPGPYFVKNTPSSPQGMPGCTAHHGRIVPSEDRDLLAMAFYGAGVVLVDFTDPRMPRMVDQFAQGTNTWEVWYYNGYLFTGDLARGLDVLTFR